MIDAATGTVPPAATANGAVPPVVAATEPLGERGVQGPEVHSALICVDDIEVAARAVLPRAVSDYVAGGSGAELTVRANRAAFEHVRLIPRVLVGSAAPDLRTRLLGTEVAMPVAVAPMAYQTLVHPDGELALARAARDAGVVYIASTFSSHPIESITACGAATWFQLYWLRDRQLVVDLIARAEAADCRALVLTVDVPRMGRRLRDIRGGFTLPDHVVAANLPASATALARRHVAGASSIIAHTSSSFEPALSWSQIDWLRDRTRLPIVLKGVLHPLDAARATEAGVAGLVVSNHGGRQLDGAIASMTALPAVRDAVAGRCELLLDGGVRSGTDVVKALASGAAGVLLGRSALWGLAVGGYAGARRVFTLLHEEIEDTMALGGCPDVAAAGALSTTSAVPC